ncbi:MAG: hypothetical protein ACSLFO_05275 [Acidimicrobiales bacterium]
MIHEDATGVHARLNDVDRLNSVMARAGEDPEVVLEATYGWVRREGA